jgi:SAM-dependent methyltransferase
MGEIFPRETAEHPEPFTGERLTTGIDGSIQIEHFHRYLFTRSLVRGLDVLDVASGEGYGSALLAQVARSVVGVEYSGSTAIGAAGNYRKPNLRFLQGDARALPLADGSFDAVVSFETIEHFDRQDDFLREVHRVLRPGGRFIVSTPERDLYSPAGSGANPFHVHELSRTEFVALLRSTFQHVHLVQQRALVGSALLSDVAASVPPVVFERRGNTHFEACIGLPRAPYLVGIASDKELQAIPPSVYIDRSDLEADEQRLRVVTEQLKAARAELARMEAEGQRSTAGLMERAEQAERAGAVYEQQVEALRRELDQVRRELEQMRQQHHALQGSLRTFIRGYLPRLRGHLTRQRP